jgi:hypothetical protein
MRNVWRAVDTVANVWIWPVKLHLVSHQSEPLLADPQFGFQAFPANDRNREVSTRGLVITCHCCHGHSNVSTEKHLHIFALGSFWFHRLVPRIAISRTFKDSIDRALLCVSGVWVVPACASAPECLISLSTQRRLLDGKDATFGFAWLFQNVQQN